MATISAWWTRRSTGETTPAALGKTAPHSALRAIGRDRGGLAPVAARDDLAQQVGMAVGVGEIAALVHDEQTRAGIDREAMAQGRVAVGAGRLVERPCGARERHGVAGAHGAIGDVARRHRLARAVGADPDRMGRGAQEVQPHRLLDGRALALGGPLPVEVGRRLEAPEVGVTRAARRSRLSGAAWARRSCPRRWRAARMAGQDGGPVEDAHLLRAGHHRRQALDRGVRQRIVVRIEAHRGGLADRDRRAFVARKRIVGQRQEPGLRLREGLAHGERPLLGTGPIGRRPPTPGGGLGIEVVQIAPGRGGKKRGANSANGPLHAPFFGPAGDRDGPRLEAVVGGQGQPGGMAADGLAPTFEHGALQIVVQPHPRAAAPGLEGRLATAQAVGQAGIAEEPPQNPRRPARHHDERHRRSLGPPDGARSEVAPIDLGRLPRQGLEAQTGFGQRVRALAQQQATEAIRAAAISALAHHGREPAGAARRVPFQGRAYEGQKRIAQRRPMGALQLRPPGLGPHPVDRAAVQAQRPGNGPHGPRLHMEVAQDLRCELRGDGHRRVRPNRAHGLRARAGGGQCIAGPSRRWRQNPGRTNAEHARPQKWPRRPTPAGTGAAPPGGCRSTRLGGQ